MSVSVTFEEGDYGLRAILKSPWSDTVRQKLRERPVAEIELNHAKGWHGNDLSFLVNFPNLRAFKILDLKISSVEPIHALHKLLSLHVTTYCKTELRFDAFPALQKCGLEWRSKATSVFECKTLKKLFINRYKGEDVDLFSRLQNLESLAILNAPVKNLHGLRQLKRLRALRLAALTKLTSLEGLEALSNLEELEIHTCRKISSIEELGSLVNLQILHLSNDGDIASLKPLGKLNRLERVTFVETTNILDGDLSPIISKHLSRVSFKNRRHYSHKREDFGNSYSGIS